MREWTQPAVDQKLLPPLCPNCGRPMHLDRPVQRSAGFSSMMFRCGECWVTEEETGFSRP